MKLNAPKLMPMLVLFFACGIYVAAQESSLCPEVKINEPSKEVFPGENLDFSVVLSAQPSTKLSYRWSVDKGSIIEGQGTNAIKVNTTGYNKTKIYATVRINGLPNDCKSEGRGYGIVYLAGRPALVEEFADIPDEDVRIRFGTAISDMKNGKVEAYVINFGSLENLGAREKLMKKIAESYGFDESMVNLYWGGHGSPIRTRVYLLANKSDFPGKEGQDIRQKTKDMFGNIWIARDESFVPCPTSLSVIEPEVSNVPAELITFSAKVVSDFKYKNLGYNWSVDQGLIVQGQGTKTITVSRKGAFRSMMTATVFPTGLPNRCLHPATGSAPTYWRPTEPISFDEIGSVRSGNLEMRIKRYASELEILSLETGYIVNYGSSINVKEREKLILDLMIGKGGIDPPRIIFVNGGVEKTIRTRLWIAPPGSDATEVN